MASCRIASGHKAVNADGQLTADLKQGRGNDAAAAADEMGIARHYRLLNAVHTWQTTASVAGSAARKTPNNPKKTCKGRRFTQGRRAL
jgi:hypothetical protein